MTTRAGAQNTIAMELSQKVWPINNVSWVHASKFFDCLHVTAPGITQEPQLKGRFSSLALVLGKMEGINNVYLEGLN